MTITPGEGRKLISVLADDYCEEMAHPHLLPCCKYDYKAERDIGLTQCLLQIVTTFFLHIQ